MRSGLASCAESPRGRTSRSKVSHYIAAGVYIRRTSNEPDGSIASTPGNMNWKRLYSGSIQTILVINTITGHSCGFLLGN